MSKESLLSVLGAQKVDCLFFCARLIKIPPPCTKRTTGNAPDVINGDNSALAILISFAAFNKKVQNECHAELNL